MVTTEANGPAAKFLEESLAPQEKIREPRKVNLEELDIPDPFSLWEPIDSLHFYNRSLAAVHVENNQEKEFGIVSRRNYATSGPEFFFGLAIDETENLPMELNFKTENPTFEVKV